jgi:DNA sulfur modification protein DndC
MRIHSPEDQQALRTAKRAMNAVVRVVRDQYLDSDDRPWVVAYSGGKDSTYLAHVAFAAVEGVATVMRTRAVYVVSTDTGVETPEIADMTKATLLQMQQHATSSRLPISAHLVTPPISDSFWVRTLGRGYPPPSRLFRWCTDRMKIAPSNGFVRSRIDPEGRVLLLLGARRSESQTRQRSMEAHSIAEAFQTHRRLPKALVWAPMQDLSTDDVWSGLLSSTPPWGGNHSILRELYKDANAGECMLVTQEGTDPCGNSRFGCWTCTVVERDKSLEGLIISGRDDLIPMHRFRERLLQVRDGGTETREDVRMNGEPGIGPLRLRVRRQLLDELLALQKQVGRELISGDELRSIRAIWLGEELKTQRPDYIDEPLFEGVLA